VCFLGGFGNVLGVVVILSKKQILSAVKEGRIKIRPFVAENVGAVSLDLRLSNVFRLLRPTPTPIVLSEKVFYPEKSTKLVKVGAEGLFLKPKQMVLGCTMEQICLPGNIAGRLEGRSRMARLGLAVHISSGLIQPGSCNVQVLEIMNNSPSTLKLVPGTPVCQVVFEEVKGQARYSGVFGRQTSP